MKKQNDDIQIKFYHLLNSQSFIEDELDYGIVNRHISLLKRLDKISPGVISVLDLFKKDHIYSSQKYESILGWDLQKAEAEGNAYSENRLHPDDKDKIFEAGLYFTTLIFGLPPEIRKDYKMIIDYRTLGIENKYVRVVEQHTVLEQDKNGNVWLTLSILDLSPYSDIESSFRSRMINTKTGDLFKFPHDETENSDLLTMREKEILHLISKGIISREIADILYISVNTVNTHRQNIIEKLDVKSTSEAVHYAMQIGILSSQHN